MTPHRTCYKSIIRLWVIQRKIREARNLHREGCLLDIQRTGRKFGELNWCEVLRQVHLKYIR